MRNECKKRYFLECYVEIDPVFFGIARLCTHDVGGKSPVRIDGVYAALEYRCKPLGIVTGSRTDANTK